MNRPTFSLFLVFLTGCGSPESASTIETRSEPEATARPATANADAPLLSANSAEDLAAAYKDAFERGDKAAIESMVYWEGIPADHRDWTLRAVFNIRFADGVNGKIKAMEVRDPLDSWLNSDAYPLPPTKMLEGSFTGDGGGGDLRIPIGEINGQFYFCARKPVSQKP